MRFHALMNEAQMLLHEHPVNAEREARGLPALNSIWFWGGGVIAAAKARPFSAGVARDPLAPGPPPAPGNPAHALPEDAESLLAAPGGEGGAPGGLGAPAGGPAPGAGAHLRRARDQQARRAR